MGTALTPTFGSLLRSEFILGVWKVGRRFVVLLDMDEMAELSVSRTR